MGHLLAKGDLCDQPGCPYYGADADPKPADFPPCPHMGVGIDEDDRNG